jgi:hypothetical protein
MVIETGKPIAEVAMAASVGGGCINDVITRTD